MAELPTSHLHFNFNQQFNSAQQQQQPTAYPIPAPSEIDFTSGLPAYSSSWTSFDSGEKLSDRGATFVNGTSTSEENSRTSTTNNPPLIDLIDDDDDSFDDNNFEDPPDANFTEKEIIQFWKSRYVHQSKSEKRKNLIFPQKLLLRIPNIENNACHALRTIFHADNCQHGQLDEKTGPNPNQFQREIYFFAGFRWSPDQEWIIAFGPTTTEAFNQAAIASLKQILGEKEYNLIVTMNKWETNPGVRRNLIDAALSRISPASTALPNSFDQTHLTWKFPRVQQQQISDSVGFLTPNNPELLSFDVSSYSSSPSVTPHYPSSSSTPFNQREMSTSFVDETKMSQTKAPIPPHRNSIIGSTGLDFLRSAPSQSETFQAQSYNNMDNSTESLESANRGDIDNESTSGSSVGGESAPELTGDDDTDDDDDDRRPSVAASQPVNKQNELKLKLLRRENKVIKFWLSRRTNFDQPDKSKWTFPDPFRLRMRKNLDQEAKAAFKSLFTHRPNHLKPVFTNPANKRPDLGLFYVKCQWDGLKNTVHGYGKTIDLAENDAGIKGLKQLFGDEEYDKLNEMSKMYKFGDLNINRINNHLTVKVTSRKLKDFQGPNYRFKHQVIASERQQLLEQKISHLNSLAVHNHPEKLKVFPLPRSKKFKMTQRLDDDCRLELDVTKRPLAVIKNPNTLPWFNFNRLDKVENIRENGVTALEEILRANSYRLPTYITVNYGYPVPLFKVECVLRDKHYFTAEASTERLAKNDAAIKALRFLIGSTNLDRICDQQEKQQQAKSATNTTTST